MTTGEPGVPTSPEDSARHDVLDAYRAHLRAMVTGDTDALGALLADDFSLTHMTGYVQPAAEWLSQIDDGQFTYHRVDERSTNLDLHDDAARIVGRIVTDATVYGTRASWRLQLELDYVRCNDTWLAVRSVASTW